MDIFAGLPTADNSAARRGATRPRRAFRGHLHRATCRPSGRHPRPPHGPLPRRLARRRARQAAPPAPGRGGAAGRGSRDAGAASVELVIATPLLITMLLVVIQFALWAHASHVAASAARGGADAARVYGAAPTAGDDAARLILAQLGGTVLTGTGVQLDRRPETVTVTVTGNAVSLLPGISLPVTGHATGTLERPTP
ncbi:TadE family protein [Parafrankia irregularis]|nr:MULTISPECIES: TadE family protein [Frankiaceae]MBE3204734.1 pilus assembly protein [Parafrankia sp. CH37]